jgi:hypothetical protein
VVAVAPMTRASKGRSTATPRLHAALGEPGIRTDDQLSIRPRTARRRRLLLLGSEMCFDDGHPAVQGAGRHIDEFERVLSVDRFVHLLEGQ